MVRYSFHGGVPEKGENWLRELFVLFGSYLAVSMGGLLSLCQTKRSLGGIKGKLRTQAELIDSFVFDSILV